MKPVKSTGMSGVSGIAYSPAKDGPFRCDRCVWFKDEVHPECAHPKVVESSDMEHDDEGHALVDAGGCCRFFRKNKSSVNIKNVAARIMSGEK